MKCLMPVFIMLFWQNAYGADLTINLSDAEKNCLLNSNKYLSAVSEYKSAAASADSFKSSLYPKIYLEGALKYTDTIPEIKTLMLSKKMGDNWNYTLGPTLYYNLIDGGNLSNAYKSSMKRAESKKFFAESIRRDILLNLRTTYFNVKLSLEEVYLIGENLQLALRQLKDIGAAAKAGTKSRLDYLQAQQEANERKRDLLRARANLSETLQILERMSGVNFTEDISLPLDYRMKGKDYGDIEKGGYINAENYDELIKSFADCGNKSVGENLPELKTLDNMADYWNMYAESIKSKNKPKLDLSLRSSLDYPNGPNIYSFWQNTAGISLSVPIFENGKNSKQYDEAFEQYKAVIESRKEKEKNIRQKFNSNKNSYKALLAEQYLNEKIINDAISAADAIYDAYKAGSATWLEVQNANVKTLNAKTEAARSKNKMLIKLAVLDSMTD